MSDRQPPPPELAPLLARLHRGQLLAGGAFALALCAGLAWTGGAEGWLVGALVATSAVTSVVAARTIIPTVAAVRKLGKRSKGRRDAE